MSLVPTHKIHDGDRAIIGRNIRPGMVPGGFSEHFGEQSKDSRAVYQEPRGMQDVRKAAERWLDDRAVRVALRDGR